MLSKAELDDLVVMARDLGIQVAGEPGVLARPVDEVNALLFIALWKRLKVMEAGFNLLADQKLRDR